MKIIISSLTLICGAALAGCQGGGGNADSVDSDAILGNLHPELRTSTERPDDVDANMAVVQDMEWRLFWDDMGRAWMTTHPTRLSPYPIRFTSGKPY